MSRPKLKAKNPRGKQSRATPGDAALERKLRGLRAFYNVGASSRRKGLTGRMEPGTMEAGVRDGKAAEVPEGMSPEMFRKARVLADPARGYTKQEFGALAAACREGGHPLGVAHVIRLLSLTKGDGTADRTLRDRLQAKAIRGKWSRRDLDVEIRRHHPDRRPYAGRRLRVPETAVEACHRLIQWCDRWKHLHHALVGPPPIDGPPGPQESGRKKKEGKKSDPWRLRRRPELPDAVLGLVKDIDRAVPTLRHMAVGLIGAKDQKPRAAGKKRAPKRAGGRRGNKPTVGNKTKG